MMTTEQWYELGCPPEWAICHHRIDNEECGDLATHTLTVRDDDGAPLGFGACSLHAALASAAAEPGELLAVQPLVTA